MRPTNGTPSIGWSPSILAINAQSSLTMDLGRRVGIRQLTNGSEVSFRHFVWCGHEICEERRMGWWRSGSSLKG